MLTRTCSACHETKPLAAFSPAQTQCKPCRRGPARAIYHARVSTPEGRAAVNAARMARYHAAKARTA
jgi:recombinational DNA repair protein (RecF pathway)